MDIILAFLEYLVDNSLSLANICNYLAGLRTMFIIHNLPTHPLRYEKIQMFVNINISFSIPFGILFIFEIVKYGSTCEKWL